MKAYVHLNTFDGRAQFSTWLTRIAMNSSLMILRTKRAHPETSIEIREGDTWQHVCCRSTEGVEHEINPCCKAAEEMRAGPSGSAFRSRSQTSPSCCGKEPWW
jgi:DNA-directed RNA polymerase specialized sigma24 family protein